MTQEHPSLSAVSRSLRSPVLHIGGQRSAFLATDFALTNVEGILRLVGDVFDRQRPRLAVVLSGVGGMPEAATRLVAGLREYCGGITCHLLGPALSSCSLLALSCDEVWISRGTGLGPVDVGLRGDMLLSERGVLRMVDLEAARAYDPSIPLGDAFALGALIRANAYVGGVLEEVRLDRHELTSEGVEALSGLRSSHLHVFTFADLRGFGVRCSRPRPAVERLFRDLRRFDASERGTALPLLAVDGDVHAIEVLTG